MSKTVNKAVSTASRAAPRLSARDWLLDLPAVFTVAEMALVMGRSRAEASQYLWRWRLTKLVHPLGGRSGVFLNLVVNPSAASDGATWERAVLKAMPSALVGGFQVLADSGLSTQVTHLRYLVISNTDAQYEIDGAEVHRRPVPWLKRLVREQALENPEPGRLLPRMRPGAALADLALYGGRPVDPDDIDLEMVDPEEAELFRELARGSDLLGDLQKDRQGERSRPSG